MGEENNIYLLQNKGMSTTKSRKHSYSRSSEEKSSGKATGDNISRNLPHNKHETSDSFDVRYTPWLKVSAAMMKGEARETMEDRILITKFTLERHTYYIFMVMDGHGGHRVASYMKNNYEVVFKTFLKKYGVSDIRKIIVDSFNYINDKVKNYRSGTTASLLLIIDDPRNIWVAHVGDSSVYGVQCGEDTQHIRLLTTNHNVSITSERRRIHRSEKHGSERGYVTMETGDMLAVTRAIGDNDFGHVIKADPTVQRVVEPYDTFMICSDGIWDVMSGRDVWKFVCPFYKKNQWRQSAFRLNEYRNATFEQHDNTSVILVFVDRKKWVSKH